MSAPKKTVAQVEAETQDELQEIMSEIESLQKEMGDSPTAKSPGSSRLKAVAEPRLSQELEAAVDGDSLDMSVEDFHGDSDEPSMEETLAGMKEEPSSGSGLLDEMDSAEAGDEDDFSASSDMDDEDEVMEDTVRESLRDQISSDDLDQMSDGSMTMTLSGKMNLRLKYECDGQEVTLGFRDQHLFVTLSDGTEFRVPLKRAPRRLKAV